jgi:antitoxin PrlF
MAVTLERVSKITAKGQTTVPKVIRDALGVDKGGTIAYRVDASGAVSLMRHEDAVDESAIDAFLAFLSRDIKQQPDAISALFQEKANALRSLVEGIASNPDDDFEGATAL